MALVNWLFSAFLLIHVHFAASYLVPLDEQAQQEFGSLLKWVWPWSGGDSGLLGEVTVASGFPLSGLFLAMAAATLFFFAALAVVELWVPFRWWRALAGTGAILSLLLMAGFFGATKILPMALDLVVLWAVVTGWLQPPN